MSNLDSAADGQSRNLWTMCSTRLESVDAFECFEQWILRSHSPKCESSVASVDKEIAILRGHNY